MKKPIIFSLLILLFGSCNRTECCVQPNIDLLGKFTHLIPNCNNNANAEINCTEWLEFVNDTEVDILYGGADIVQRFTYIQGIDFISLEGPPTSSFKPIFIIKNPSTLERKDNGDIWQKE